MALYDVGLAGGEAEKIAFDNSVSGMYSDNVQGAIDELKGTIGCTKKNLLKNINITSAQTYNGVTCTPNADGSFTLTGELTAGTTFAFFNINYVADTNAFSNGNYKMSGSYSGGGVSLELIKDGVSGGFDKDSQGLDFTIENTTSNMVRIFVNTRADLTNGVTIYPMVRYASIKDDTFVPYAADIDTRLEHYDYLDISDKITVTSNCHSIAYAYVKNGFVHIKGTIDASATTGEWCKLFTINDPVYIPKFASYGILSYRSTNDLSKILNVRAESDGSGYVWLTSTLSAHTTFSLMYPIK